MINRILAISLILSLLSLQSLYAAEKSAAVLPFQQVKLKDASICRYSQKKRDWSHSGLPELFGNVKAIHLIVRSNFNKRSFGNIFSLDDVEILAGCTLEKILSSEEKITKGITSNPPIYIKSNAHYIAGWPETYGDGHLIALLELEIQDGNGFFQKLFQQKIVIVQAHYYRQDAEDVPNALDHCALAFPFTDDSEILLKTLTRAVHGCLNRPYWNPAGD